MYSKSGIFRNSENLPVSRLGGMRVWAETMKTATKSKMLHNLSCLVEVALPENYIIMSFQTFNIFTANGSVIPLQPGATGEQAGTSETNATGTTTTSGGAVETSKTTTAQSGMISSLNATIGIQTRISGEPAQHPGIYHGAFVYNRQIPYYIPPKTYNPHIIARNKEFLDTRGFARVSK